MLLFLLEQCLLCHGIACVTKIVIRPVRRPFVTLSEARKYFCSFERVMDWESLLVIYL